jgi:hypothetical protein
LTVHSRPSRPVCRACRITGSAFVTMRLSIEIMNTAMQQARYVQNGFFIPRFSPSGPRADDVSALWNGADATLKPAR